jgi:hypothetical protein
VDSLYHWYSDDKISSSGDRKHTEIGTLRNTDGTCDGIICDSDGMVECHDGEMAHEDDVVYSTHYDAHVQRDAATETHYDGWIYDDEVCTLDSHYSGGDDTCHQDNATEAYDGGMIHSDDAVRMDLPCYKHYDSFAHHDDIATLHNGYNILSDDAIELHDGRYAWDDDEDVVELTDGRHALIGECTVNKDGSYTLTADA